MSEMVERVARAIYEDYATKSPSAHLPWDALEPFSRQLAISNARAAIEAMRESTAAMLDKAIEAGGDYYRGDFIGWDEIPVMWRAMIDAALKP